MKWSEQKAMDLSDEEAGKIELRAARIEEAYRPDGAVEYVPQTEAGQLFVNVRDGIIAKSEHPMIGAAYKVFRAAALGQELVESVEFEDEQLLESNDRYVCYQID